MLRGPFVFSCLSKSFEGLLYSTNISDTWRMQSEQPQLDTLLCNLAFLMFFFFWKFVFLLNFHHIIIWNFLSPLSVSSFFCTLLILPLLITSLNAYVLGLCASFLLLFTIQKRLITHRQNNQNILF